MVTPMKRRKLLGEQEAQENQLNYTDEILRIYPIFLEHRPQRNGNRKGFRAQILIGNRNGYKNEYRNVYR